MYARLIDVDYIKANTNIDINVDARKLEEYIDVSQESKIQDILGYALYQKVMQDVYDLEVNGVTMSSPYTTLLYDYIMPAQAKWVVWYVLPDIQFNMTNKSISKKSSEYGEPISLEELSYIRKNRESLAQVYSDKVANYLLNNTASFPELNTSTGIDRPQPFSNNFNGGIYFSKKNRWC